MSEGYDIFATVYRRGVAVGQIDIRTDDMHFTFKGEKFTFPGFRVVPHIAKWNGYFYEAPIDKLRELEREAASG